VNIVSGSWVDILDTTQHKKLCIPCARMNVSINKFYPAMTYSQRASVNLMHGRPGCSRCIEPFRGRLLGLASCCFNLCRVNRTCVAGCKTPDKTCDSNKWIRLHLLSWPHKNGPGKELLLQVRCRNETLGNNPKDLLIVRPKKERWGDINRYFSIFHPTTAILNRCSYSCDNEGSSGNFIPVGLP
jgi:hypothetical protein